MNYTLNIISKHPEFLNKTLRKHHIEGIDTVGAYEEEFEIVFKNNSHHKVGVVISVDGIDILNGTLASTDNHGKMWIVNGYGELRLQAYPETNFGGAAFRFTNAENSVVSHISSNCSSRGIIAAAIYVENNMSMNPIYWPLYPTPIPKPSSRPEPIWIYYSYTTCNTGINSSITNSHTNIQNVNQNPGVGAGQYAEQKITYQAGLINPHLNETIRIRYMWWDDLVAKLRADNNVTITHPTGFPADEVKKNIDLKNSPRTDQELAAIAKKITQEKRLDHLTRIC